MAQSWDALNKAAGAVQTKTPAPNVPPTKSWDALNASAANPVNAKGFPVAGHVMNPNNPTNQLDTPVQPSGFGQILKDTFNPKNLIMAAKKVGNTLYDSAGQIIAPGITHDELRNPQILKDTVTGIPLAIYKVGKQIITHPIDTSADAITSAAKGISETITNGIINVAVPKADRQATKDQVQQTLDKYLRVDTTDPVRQAISQGYEQAGKSAPFIAAGGIAGEAAGMAGFAGANAAGASLKTASSVITGSEFAGNTAGFLAAGQTQVPLEATVKQRTDQLMNDLIGLGLFTAGSLLFKSVKAQATDAVRASLLSKDTSGQPPGPGGSGPDGGFPKSSPIPPDVQEQMKQAAGFETKPVPGTPGFTTKEVPGTPKIAVPEELKPIVTEAKNYGIDVLRSNLETINTKIDKISQSLEDNPKATLKTLGYNNNDISNPQKIAAVVDYTKGRLAEIKDKAAQIKDITTKPLFTPDQIAAEKAPVTDTKISDQAYKETAQNGGVTISLEGNKPAEGYAYSPYKNVETVIPKETFTEQHVADFITKNTELLNQPGNHLGIWEDSGKIYLDVLKVGPATPETITAAEKAGQQGVFDLKKFETIKTKLYDQKANSPDLNPGQKPAADTSRVSPGNKEIPSQKASGIARSIEAKAIEAKLTKGFSNVAGYEPLTFKEQAAKSADLINSGIDNARAVVRGEKPLPEGLRGTALIAGMEEYLKTHPNADMAEELANSPHVTGNSVAAQELGLSRMREQDSATAKLAQIKKAKIESMGGDKVVASAKKALISEVKKVALTKEELSWDKFLESIKC